MNFTTPAKTSIVYFTTHAPTRLGEALLARGYQVFEALSISEVLYVCEHHNIAVILIAHDVEHFGLDEITSRYLTIQLKPAATERDVLWELSLLFQKGSRPVQ
jgi:hypothetical protein